MSEQEAFNSWLKNDVVISSADDKTTAAEWAWQACAERKDIQMKELLLKMGKDLRIDLVLLAISYG